MAHLTLRDLGAAIDLFKLSSRNSHLGDRAAALSRRRRRCELCLGTHRGNFGSGRFCNALCARKYSSSFKYGRRATNKNAHQQA